VEIAIAGRRAALGTQMMDEVQGQITQIELLPDLSHCVETRAKQEYTATMSKILSGDQSPSLDERLDLLKAFLDTAGFSRLRRESEEHMIQGRKVKFVISGFAGHSEWSLQMTVED
jgi:hypothetical protein